MKKIYLFQLLFSGLTTFAQDTSQVSVKDTVVLENIQIEAVRAADKAPFTKTNLSASEIGKQNSGRDLPFILAQTPSLIAGSDAGNGIGYTNMRIRGTDATRINVTLNGIPFNDAESQGAFLVNINDIASSASSIQIQRGLGTSSNGSGAFGASVHISTIDDPAKKYLELNQSAGSFGTLKNTIKASTGLIRDRWSLDGRVSRIVSDGYIDRSGSKLNSFLAGATYVSGKSTLRFQVMDGKEKTQQAWYGISEEMLQKDRTFNPAGTEKPGEPYENETDNYHQTHYQLFFNSKLNALWKLNTAAFLTRGKGYYEEYRAGQKYSKYGQANPIVGGTEVAKTDLIRQKWLDNYFFGGLLSAQYVKGNTNLTFGGGAYQYLGDHYGYVKWAQNGGFPVDFQWYDNPARKFDANLYARLMQSLGSGFTAFADAQARLIDYSLDGFRDNPNLMIHKEYLFFNPRAGISFNTYRTQIYGSLAVATKEPNRDDFEAGEEQIPKPETLYDWELGFQTKESRFSYGATFYYMNYRNQLVNSGRINDVGSYTRVNVPHSYRAGIELQGAAIVTDWLNIQGNVAFSQNKIRKYTEYVDDWSGDKQKEEQYTNTDISFSPGVVGFAAMNFMPVKNGEISFESKWVGSQYLDNTSNADRQIDAYFVENVRLMYTIEKKRVPQIDLILAVNNVFNTMYVSNGYTYRYISNGELQADNAYFPMAGTNFLATVNIRF